MIYYYLICYIISIFILYKKLKNVSIKNNFTKCIILFLVLISPLCLPFYLLFKYKKNFISNDRNKTKI